MNNIRIIAIILTIASIVFTQSVIVKDDGNNPLIQINDEGTAGSISLPNAGAVTPFIAKLYNNGGNLFWGNQQLGTAGSAGGWTDGGTDVYLTTAGDKVGIGTSSPITQLDVTGIIRANQPAGITGSLQLSAPGSVPGLILVSNDDNFRATIAREDNGLGIGVHAATTNPATYAMYIQDNGNVAIGVPAPDRALTIGNYDSNLSNIRLARPSASTVLDIWSSYDDGTNLLSYGTYPGGDLWGVYSTPATWIITAEASTGNVGIGTSTPGAELEVAGQVKITGGSPGLNKVLTSDATGLATWQAPAVGDGHSLDANDGDPVDALYIDAVGKVGIGTTTPYSRFHVHAASGTSYFRATDVTTGETTGARFGVNGSGDAFIINDYATGSLALGTGSSADMYISNDGNIGIGSVTPSANLHIVGSSSIGTILVGPEGDSDNDSELFLAEDDDGTYGMKMTYDGGDNRFYVFGKNDAAIVGPHLTIENYDGDVGIGITNPTAKLDIAGNIKIADGTQGAGKVLTSDAAGLATWENPAADGHSLDASDGNPVDALFVNDIGKVGIGELNPAVSLTINSGSINTFLFLQNSSSGNGINDGFELGMSNSDANIRNQEYGTLTISTRDFHNLTLDHFNGRVGVGVTSPTSRLDVNGDVEIDDDDALYFGEPDTDGSWRIIREGNNLVFQRRESGGTWNTIDTMTP